MKLVALSVVCLWGALFLCANVTASSSNFYIMRDAALSFPGKLPCGTWDCNCAFQRQRSCCCVANELFALEESIFRRLVGLWSQITRLEEAVEEITEEHQIAFTASMANRADCFGPFTTNVSIPYTNVSLNQGYGYNPALGVFTAPRGGYYIFSFTAYSKLQDPNGRLYHKLQMMKNGNVIVSMWEDNREDSEDTGTQVVVLKLERGCQVYMELVSGRNLCGNTGGYNIFTGYLLYPDYTK